LGQGKAKVRRELALKREKKEVYQGRGWDRKVRRGAQEGKSRSRGGVTCGGLEKQEFPL